MGPWVTTALGSAAGLRGDAKLTILGLAVVALMAIAVCRVRRIGLIVAALAAAGALGVAGYDLVHLGDDAAQLGLAGAPVVAAGWGLYASLIGAAVATVGLASQAARRTSLALASVVFAATVGAIIADVTRVEGTWSARASAMAPLFTVPTVAARPASSSSPTRLAETSASAASSSIHARTTTVVTGRVSMSSAVASVQPPLFAATAEHDCLASGNIVPFLRATHANVLRLILDSRQAQSGEGIGCAEAAHAAGFKVYISLQFVNAWTPKEVAAYFRHVLPGYVPFLWAVGVGNEQDLTGATTDAQGMTALGRPGQSVGDGYRADWDAVEPVLVKIVPHAIRVYGEFSPWGFNADKQGFAKDRPPGVQAIAAHCYHTKRAGGLLQVPQNAAWAASQGLPLWCSEMGPALPVPTIPGWAVPDSWPSWNAALARVKTESPDLQMTSYYYWPTF
jgi:hypothetical protein